MTTVREAGSMALAAGRRQQVAAVLVVVLAVAMLVTGIIGVGKLWAYQVILDFLAAVLLLGACWVMLRTQKRWPTVLLTWLSVIGVIAELGDYQARKNNTGALSATNTSYFLPGLLWLYMFLLIVLALLIMSLSAIPKAQQKH